MKTEWRIPKFRDRIPTKKTIHSVDEYTQSGDYPETYYRGKKPSPLWSAFDKDRCADTLRPLYRELGFFFTHREIKFFSAHGVVYHVQHNGPVKPSTADCVVYPNGFVDHEQLKEEDVTLWYIIRKLWHGPIKADRHTLWMLVNENLRIPVISLLAIFIVSVIASVIASVITG